MNKETAAMFIMGSLDVQEELCINRSRLKALVDAGKLKPMKELKREYIFWKPDVEMLKQTLLLDSRSNLYKRAKGDAKQNA